MAKDFNPKIGDIYEDLPTTRVLWRNIIYQIIGIEKNKLKCFRIYDDENTLPQLPLVFYYIVNHLEHDLEEGITKKLTGKKYNKYKEMADIMRLSL